MYGPNGYFCNFAIGGQIFQDVGFREVIVHLTSLEEFYWSHYFKMRLLNGTVVGFLGKMIFQNIFLSTVRMMFRNDFDCF